MNNELVLRLLKEGYIVSLFEYLDIIHYTIGVPLDNPVFGIIYVYFNVPEGEYYAKAFKDSPMIGIQQDKEAVILQAWNKFDLMFPKMFDLI
jgi:hypothetical protein